jgi:hypothetical protein
MQKKPLVKLGFAVLVAVAALMGLNSAPARALDCPSGFGSCVYDSQDEECCYYVNVDNPEISCPNFCH